MTVQRGELWWADLAEPRGSEPALRRPVLVLQADSFNRSRLQGTGLRERSVVNATQISALDRRFLHERIGRLSSATLGLVEDGVRLVLGLSSIGQ